VLLNHVPSISTSTSQKEDREEAEAARGVAVHPEDVVHHEAGVVAEEALEAIVVAEALGAAEAQEGSAVVVAVAEASEDLGEAVVDSEAHDIVFMYVKKIGCFFSLLDILKSSMSHGEPSRPRIIRPFRTKTVSSPNIRSYSLIMS
jgi:hypothetical protein